MLSLRNQVLRQEGVNSVLSGGDIGMPLIRGMERYLLSMGVDEGTLSGGNEEALSGGGMRGLIREMVIEYLLSAPP